MKRDKMATSGGDGFGPLATDTVVWQPIYHPPQGTVLASQQQLHWSHVVNDNWLSHHRLELENDLIAAHILQTGEIPTVQFLG